MIDQKVIAQKLGVESLLYNTKLLPQEHEDEGEDIHIIAYWIADTSYFRPKRGGSVTVAVIHTEYWTRGILLIREPTKQDFSSQYTMKPLVMNHWEDSVLNALTHINLVPVIEYDIPMLLSKRMFTLRLNVGTRGSEGKLFFQDWFTRPRKRSLHRLFQSVVETIWYMVEQYDDDEIRQFITEELDNPNELRYPFWETQIGRFIKRTFKIKTWWEREREKALATNSNIVQ